ncbi:MAG: PKD domain-containing protein [Kiritimatiellae bacterium]|nr:PKD domain-containing protein [Kiritimatiellia bacterium]
MRATRIVPTLIVSVALAATSAATDYYVATDGNDGNDGQSSATPFATIDAAITAATAASDVIHVAAGTYSTATQWGPNLTAKLIGEGATRDDVVIQSAGTYRTLRMAAGSWVEKVTVVGEGTYKADKGGAIEMSGGTVTNCVIRGGTAKNGSANTEGGNLYVNGSSLVVDCAISGGHATKRGGNVYLDAGTVRDCTITGGICDNVGGNVFQNTGTMAKCLISGGTSVNDGGNVRMNGSGTMEDCVVSGGTNTATSGDKKGANVYMDSSAKISRCHLIGGVHTAYNGGSLCVYSSSVRVEDCLVEGSECGGVLLGGTSYLYNCTVVDNDKYGVWAWNNTQHIFNTVIYGNTDGDSNKDWTGNMPENSSAEFLNNAVTENGSRHTTSAYPTLVLLADDSAFVDYANGDYSPAPGGALVDAGISDPRGAAASATDLAGNPRASGNVDIGCYEYQKPDMTVRIDGAAYSQVYAPATVTFTHVAENSADPSKVSFVYDFGDGSATESTSESTISHAYANPGVYTVTIAAESECEEDVPATMVYDGYVRVASSTVYVTAGNTAGQAFPYDTPETGYGNLKTAVQSALDGYTLLLGEGVYETSDQISFNKAITIRGLGATPEGVIVRNTSTTPNTYYFRTLEMNNPTGRIENITIENGCVKNQNGGNLRLVTGVVSNCVIRGGLAVADNGNAAGSAVELAGAGVLTHCVVSNNVVQGTSNSGSSAGGAIYIPYGAKNGRVSNCLVAYNRYETSGDAAKAGAAGIRFNGSNDNMAIENCTIAANTVAGSLEEDTAGIHCTSWNARFRNNIVVGNYETGKGSYTSVKIDSHCTYVNNIDDAAAFTVFRDFMGGDFHVEPGSPACNKGTRVNLSLLPSVDLAGNPRVFGREIDVGCYECQKLRGMTITIR